MLNEQLREALSALVPARALDVACGSGEHALFLASLGWRVTAVDRDEPAIAHLQGRPNITAMVIDLERETLHHFGCFELILVWRYFQRDLLDGLRPQLEPGGVLATAVKTNGRFAAPVEQLKQEFAHWPVLLSTTSGNFAALIVRKPL